MRLGAATAQKHLTAKAGFSRARHGSPRRRPSKALDHEPIGAQAKSATRPAAPRPRTRNGRNHVRPRRAASLSSQGSASLTPTATSSSYASSSKPSEFNDDASSISTVSEESEESKEPEPYQLPHDRAVATMNEDEDDESYSSESSGESIVPDLGGDEDDDPSAKATGAGLLGYLGLGGQPTKATEDDYAYDFEGEPQEPVDDEHYDFGLCGVSCRVDGVWRVSPTRRGDDEEPELDEDELAEEGLKDDRLEARLALAYDVATAGVSSGREHPMKAPNFGKRSPSWAASSARKKQIGSSTRPSRSPRTGPLLESPQKETKEGCSSGTSSRRIPGGMPYVCRRTTSWPISRSS